MLDEQLVFRHHVPVAASMAAYRAATAHLSDATFAVISDGDHLMGLESAQDVSAAYLSVLIDWLTTRLVMGATAA